MDKHITRSIAAIIRSALRACSVTSRQVACYVVGGEVRVVVRDADLNVIKIIRAIEAAGYTPTADLTNAAPGVPCFRVR